MERDGYVVVRGALRASEVDALRDALGDGSSRRDLLAVAAVRHALATPRVRTLAYAIVGPRAVAVRALSPRAASSGAA